VKSPSRGKELAEAERAIVVFRFGKGGMEMYREALEGDFDGAA
jgi:hypothetical protein